MPPSAEEWIEKMKTATAKFMTRKQYAAYVEQESALQQKHNLYMNIATYEVARVNFNQATSAAKLKVEIVNQINAIANRKYATKVAPFGALAEIIALRNRFQDRFGYELVCIQYLPNGLGIVADTGAAKGGN